MAKGLSYTARTKRALEDMGVFVGKTEQFNPYAGGKKPYKRKITDAGGSKSVSVGDILTEKEFTEQQDLLTRSGLELMKAELVDDGQFGVRQDLFGFIDMIALYPGDKGIVGIQSTGPSGLSAHRRKIIDECSEKAIAWLKCGGKIELWSWKEVVIMKGKKATRWVPRVEEITMKHFEVVIPVEDPQTSLFD